MSRRPPPFSSGVIRSNEQVVGGVLGRLRSARAWVTAALLASVAVTGVRTLSDEVAESPFVGLVFAVVIVTALLALTLVLRRDERGWWVAVAASMFAMVGHLLQHSTTWLGLFSECAIALISLAALLHTFTSSTNTSQKAPR
jgi:hypothetical protein